MDQQFTATLQKSHGKGEGDTVTVRIEERLEG
jgi:hypothetical protein